jgi:hypothetical protein
MSGCCSICGMETYKLILIGSFILLSGFFEGQMDKISFDFYHSLYVRWPLFFNPKVSHINKFFRLNERFTFTDEHGQKHWIKKFDKTKERFPGSTSILVFLTDGWHLFKMISNTLMIVALTIVLSDLLGLNWWQGSIAGIIIKIINLIAFSISYKLK